jgi:DUF1365 family protein
MNSCLYRATVMHNRLEPKQHRFHYNVFMFYIDLDETGLLRKKLWMFSHNRFNFFSFRDREHLQLSAENPDKNKSTKQHILDYLLQNGIDLIDGKIMLLTNLNVLGYNFNPVSFYFCFDESQQPVCCIAEVGNTFREMKPYLIKRENLAVDTFQLNTKKYFYVSPFIDHDTDFDFNLTIPNEKLKIKIDDYKEGRRFFISTLTGNKKVLSNWNLFKYMVRFPFITLKIVTLIHWNAVLLWLKKIAYHPKSANQHLQKDVYKRYKIKGEK